MVCQCDDMIWYDMKWHGMMMWYDDMIWWCDMISTDEMFQLIDLHPIGVLLGLTAGFGVLCPVVFIPDPPTFLIFSF